MRDSDKKSNILYYIDKTVKMNIKEKNVEQKAELIQ